MDIDWWDIQCWKFHPAMVMNFLTLGCAISSSVADVWRRMSHCVKREGGRMQFVDSWPATPRWFRSHRKTTNVRESWCFLFFSPSFLCLLLCYVVFQFQIVLLLWGIFSQAEESSCFPCARFSSKNGTPVAGRALQSCTWPTRLEGAKVQGRIFFIFEILEEGRIHVSFIHIKTYKVEV